MADNGVNDLDYLSHECKCGLVSVRVRRLQVQSREFRHKSDIREVPQHQGLVVRIPQRAFCVEKYTS